MSQFDVDTLTGISSSTAGIASGQVNSAADVKDWMDEATSDLAALNDAIQAIATSQSGSTAPGTNRQGELFHDIDINTWLGDPDGAGHDDEFLTRLTAKDFDLATGGTAVYKIAGAISVITADDARTTVGDFTSFTLPANTLDANGKYIHCIWAGTRTGTAATFSLQPKLGATNLGAAFASVITSLTDWAVECWIVRTGTSAQDVVFKVTPNSDGTGSTTLCDAGITATEDETSNLAVALDLTAISAGTVTQTLFIVELFN